MESVSNIRITSRSIMEPSQDQPLTKIAGINADCPDNSDRWDKKSPLMAWSDISLHETAGEWGDYFQSEVGKVEN